MTALWKDAKKAVADGFKVLEHGAQEIASEITDHLVKDEEKVQIAAIVDNEFTQENETLKVNDFQTPRHKQKMKKATTMPTRTQFSDTNTDQPQPQHLQLKLQDDSINILKKTKERRKSVQEEKKKDKQIKKLREEINKLHEEMASMQKLTQKNESKNEETEMKAEYIQRSEKKEDERIKQPKDIELEEENEEKYDVAKAKETITQQMQKKDKEIKELKQELNKLNDSVSFKLHIELSDVANKQNEYKQIQCCQCGYCFSVCKYITISILYFVDIILIIFAFLYAIMIRFPYYCILNCCSNICCTKQNETEKIVVIIGYSFAGLEIHTLLQSNSSLSHFHFIIIEPKSYIEYTPSILKSIVNPKEYKTMSFSLKKCIDSKNSELIQGKAISLKSNSVCIELIDKSTKLINFNYCFICTGSKYLSPIKVNSYPNITDNTCIYYKQRQRMLNQIHSNLIKAESICVVGGGPVGVELTAEISQQFPSKQITIIDGNNTICRSFPEMTRNYLQKWIENQPNVTLELNKRINKVSDKSVQFVDSNFNNKTLAFDIIFVCMGFSPNSELLQSDNDFKYALSDGQFIIVDEWMRVKNQTNIFALGDVMLQPKINEVKLAHIAEIHARYLADLMQYTNKTKNDPIHFKPYHEWLLGEKITANENTKNEEKWKMPMVFMISLGSKSGAMGMFNILLNGCCVPILKWFVEWSLCKSWLQANLFHIDYNQHTIFKMYAIGHRISHLICALNHYIFLSKVRNTYH
eukprot:457522_1